MSKIFLPFELMKFKRKDSEHRKHYFVVDKSNTFSVCAICGLRKERKIIGWDTKEEKST